MTQSVRGFVVATKCETVEDFVDRYHTRIDDTSIFVGIIEERALGAECAFAILLANKQPVFAGICEVLAIYRDRDNPYQRSGMRLGIRRLGITSEPIFAEMKALGAAAIRRFPRGSTAPPENEPIDAIPIDVMDEESGSIPIDLEETLTRQPSNERAQ
jgi:hypothetical protein